MKEEHISKIKYKSKLNKLGLLKLWNHAQTTNDNLNMANTCSGGCKQHIPVIAV